MAEEPLGGYPGGYWGAGASALGTGADIYAFFDNLKRRRQMEALQEILSNPVKLQAYIQSYYQPMTGAAINATNRDIGANWATQTGGAPGGALNQFTADAFAKLESQRYGTAAEQAIQALTGGTRGYGGGGGQPMGNLRGILDILTRLRGSQPTTPTPTPKPQAQPPATPYPLPGSEETTPDFTGGPF